MKAHIIAALSVLVVALGVHAGHHEEEEKSEAAKKIQALHRGKMSRKGGYSRATAVMKAHNYIVQGTPEAKAADPSAAGRAPPPAARRLPLPRPARSDADPATPHGVIPTQPSNRVGCSAPPRLEGPVPKHQRQNYHSAHHPPDFHRSRRGQLPDTSLAEQHGEALAAGTAQVLANISEATGLELEEGVVDPGLARRAAAERDRTLRTKLVEAQVALNGLDAACEAHLGRLRLHLEDEVGASYGADRADPAVAKLLEAVAALGRRGSAGEAFGDALEKARAALASTALAQPIARSIAGRGDVGARARFALGDGDAVAPHRWACAEALYEALGRVDDFGAAARRAAAAAPPSPIPHAVERIDEYVVMGAYLA